MSALLSQVHEENLIKDNFAQRSLPRTDEISEL